MFMSKYTLKRSSSKKKSNLPKDPHSTNYFSFYYYFIFFGVFDVTKASPYSHKTNILPSARPPANPPLRQAVTTVSALFPYSWCPTPMLQARAQQPWSRAGSGQTAMGHLSRCGHEPTAGRQPGAISEQARTRADSEQITRGHLRAGAVTSRQWADN